MALLKMSEIKKMDGKERKEKLKELRLELIRSNVGSNKTNTKSKEIKRAIARLITFNKSRKGGS